MFNLFNKKRNKAAWKADVESVIDSADYEKRARTFAELEERISPLRDERHKAMFVITEIYKRHDIEIELRQNYRDDCYLDEEVLTDLGVFNDEELAALRKWSRRYKEDNTKMIELMNEYHKEMNNV